MTSSGFHKNNTGLVWVSLPLVVVLFSSVSWEADRRTKSDVEKLLDLKRSTWSWDKDEYEVLLERVDVNQYVEGRPLFVMLAIEGEDKRLLQKMIARGANLNSTAWGCTPLLASLDLDREFAEILVRSGADLNLVPSEAEVNKRIASGIPAKICKSFDGLSKEQRMSVLRIFIELAQDESLINLLAERGAKPQNQKDAQAILKKAMSGWKYKGFEQTLTQLAVRYGASLNDDDDQSGTPLIRAVRGSLGPDQINEVKRLIDLGADPNKRSPEDMLPLQVAIDRCVNSARVFTNQDEENRVMRSFMEQSWAKADMEAREKNGKPLQLVEALLQGGADPNLPLQVGAGGSILTYAVAHCPSDVPNALLNHGAKVTASAIEAAHFGLRERLLKNHER